MLGHIETLEMVFFEEIVCSRFAWTKPMLRREAWLLMSCVPRRNAVSARAAGTGVARHAAGSSRPQDRRSALAAAGRGEQVSNDAVCGRGRAGASVVRRIFWEGRPARVGLPVLGIQRWRSSLGCRAGPLPGESGTRRERFGRGCFEGRCAAMNGAGRASTHGAGYLATTNYRLLST